MFGYVFIYGLGCFGADTALDEIEGIYLDFDKAFARQCELNTTKRSKDIDFYEDGYGENYYPETNYILAEAEKNEDWDTYREELAKHKLTDIKEICEQINSLDEPPLGYYQLVELEIYE